MSNTDYRDRAPRKNHHDECDQSHDHEGLCSTTDPHTHVTEVYGVEDDGPAPSLASATSASSDGPEYSVDAEIEVLQKAREGL